MSQDKKEGPEYKSWMVRPVPPRILYEITVQQEDGGYVRIKGRVQFGHRRYINPDPKGKDHLELCFVVEGNRVDDGSRFVQHLSPRHFFERVHMEQGPVEKKR